jgi:hypothetical protein
VRSRLPRRASICCGWWIRCRGAGFSGIDRNHEGQRRHPGTVEKKSGDWCLWQLLEKPEYQGGLGTCLECGCAEHMLT